VTSSPRSAGTHSLRRYIIERNYRTRLESMTTNKQAQQTLIRSRHWGSNLQVTAAEGGFDACNFDALAKRRVEDAISSRELEPPRGSRRLLEHALPAGSQAIVNIDLGRRG
jgi:hypothetical protein